MSAEVSARKYWFPRPTGETCARTEAPAPAGHPRTTPDAEVEVERDPDGGWITWLSIDHLPEAIDDEECYRVTGVREVVVP